ncbi:MAG: site-specific DNA-methyltransferase [Deltaproteobacteria bacterium]|nr:site-specific DNA-methyltransferase [Deltaproteobacteria bacterium]
MARRGAKQTVGRRAESARPIELCWPGKPPAELPDRGAPLPELDVIERLDPRRMTVDSRSGREGAAVQIDLHMEEPAGDGQAPNQLIVGDNLIAMEALAPSHAGTIDLIYIDPPFATGLSYFSQHGVGKLQGGAIERRAYRDNRAGGMAGYLDAMYVRFIRMRQLLTDEGKLFVHCDWRANSLLRLLLDEIFGSDGFRNEIIWRRAPNLGRQAASRQLGRVFDSIYVYSKTPGAAFTGEVPRRRAEVVLDGKGKPKGARWDEDRKLYFTTAPRGDYTDASIAKLRDKGRVFESSTGTIYIKYFLTPGPGGRWVKEQPVDALWDDFEVRPLRHRPKSEQMGYDTQKPEGLLERIIRWSTRPGDLVADFYAGSGTTPAVAEALGRRWIASDIGQTAIDITRRRLLDLAVAEPDGQGHRRAHPFEIRSALEAERMAWGRALEADEDRTDRAKLSEDEPGPSGRHILEAYGAKAQDGDWVDTDGRHVALCIAGPEASPAEVEAACGRAAEAGASEVVVLAWSWAPFDGGALKAEMTERHSVAVSLRTIPFELLRSQPKRGKAHFAERPEVDLELAAVGEDRWQVSLCDVRCPDPPRVRKSSGDTAMSFPEVVDSWMVDFQGDRGVFAPTWCSHRSRAARQLALTTPPRPVGARSVRVKVVTVFGDEIARTLTLKGTGR